MKVGRGGSAQSIPAVWILGAGFSRPLGGPLLSDLFRPESKQILERMYPEDRFGNLSSALFHAKWLYSYHRGRWSDPEDFLSCIDEYSRNDMSILEQIVRRTRTSDPTVSGTPGDLIDMVRFPLNKVALNIRRAFAAECEHFTRRQSREVWNVYRRWFEHLDTSDSIITFNYDLVLETLCQTHPNRALIAGIDPDAEDRVRILKLHGSIDWIENTKGEIERIDPCQALASEHPIAIAAPGPTKSEMTDRLFENNWKSAEDTIRRAGIIVFLGYRFPESDSNSLRRLTDAIALNYKFGHIRVDIVLGVESRAPHVVRVERLLADALTSAGRRRVTDLKDLEQQRFRGPADFTSYAVNTPPYWAQDYLLMWRQQYLEGEYWFR